MGLRLLWFGMKSLIDYCGDLFVRYTPRTPRTKFIVKPSKAMAVIPIPPFAYSEYADPQVPRNCRVVLTVC
jgi:hypothetical protein